jgi:starch-binding outer membrane protein, SusD/RagB family
MTMRTEESILRKALAAFRKPSLAILAFGALALAGCELGVSNPAEIEEADLETEAAVPAIVNGARHTFGLATTIFGGGGVYSASALLTDELVHSGSWVPLREISEGLPGNESPENQSHWGYSSQARWQAEDAIGKAQGLVQDPAGNQWVAMAMLYAGFSNRLMGDMFCDAVVDGGPRQNHTTFHERAVGFFTSAAEVAQAGGHADLRNAALAGRAQARMMLGEWDQAVSDAQQVSTSFRFEHVHSENSTNEHNGVHNWAVRGDNGDQMTVWGTPFAEWGLAVDGGVESEGDPRVSFRVVLDGDGSQVVGGDNRRPLWYSQKYASRSTGIPMAKGTEMRLIQAEAQLRGGQVQAAVSFINDVRAHHGLDPVSATSATEAWDLLVRERGIELWLEGRRLADLRRWAADPATAPRAGLPVVREVAFGQPAVQDPARNVLDADPLCLRVSTNEIASNPNLQSDPPR